LAGGNYRSLNKEETQEIFGGIPDEASDKQSRLQQKTSGSFIRFLLENLFAVSENERNELFAKAEEGPSPSWPRKLAVLMQKASEHWSISLSSIFWVATWTLAWWLMIPSLRWPFTDRVSAYSAIVMYVGGTLAVPLLIGALITTKDSEYWKQQGLSNSILLRLYTYQGAAIGFNLGYFFVFPFILVWYYLQLGSSVWLELAAITLGLILGAMGARVVPHNLWLAYGRLRLADGAIFFVVALLGPLWGLFFLQYYAVLLTPLLGSVIILTALTLLITIAAQQAKKTDTKQAQP
jgi:hypothetical protein